LAGKRILITGATGLLGSHIAERLAARGDGVRALVRPTSEVAFLQSIGVELVPGDLSDPPSLRRAVEGAEVVYHCAARVGDWGSWPQFQAQVIDATANLLAACRAARVGRFLHVSSIAVYGHPKPRAELFTEDEPLGQNLWWWDHYVRAKMAAEALVRDYPGDWTVVRPSWMYGPRDRTSLPRVLAAVEAGRAAVLGRGDNLLNLVYAADVAEGAVLAADSPVARGRAYHLSSEGDVAQRDLLDLLTDALGRPRVRKRWPYPLAFAAGFWAEAFARLTRQSRPPHLTRYAVAVLGRPTRFSIERAKTELGWRPRTPAKEGLYRSLDWHRNQVAARAQ
jgi:nucleoside-diphosphate-sugar epimerase